MSDKRVVVDPYAGVEHEDFTIRYDGLIEVLCMNYCLDVKTIKTVSIDADGVHIEYVPEG